MSEFSNWLHKISTGWVVLASLIIFTLFAALVLPAQADQAETYSGDVGSPDTSFYYTADRLYQFAEEAGPQGRQAYIRARLTFDVLWPLVYTAFLASAISWLAQKSGQKNRLLGFANLVPILGMVFDFLENTATSIVMSRYPSETPLLASLAGFLTAVKWIFVGVSFIVLMALVGLAVWNRLRKKAVIP